MYINRQLKQAYEGMTSNYAKGWQVYGLEQRIKSLDRKLTTWSKVSLPTKTLNELVQRTELFENNDPAAPRGLLLEGPSGTGKTLTARCIAEATNCYFEAITLADVKQKELGFSSQKVRELWNRAREKQPAILFFDECEGVFGQRGAAETDVVASEIVKTILAEWNDDTVRPRIMVIGATNRPDLIDSAILSRFDWKLTVALPDKQERLDILRREMSAMDANSVVPDEMGELTQGMSGRDLRNLASQVRTIAYPNTPTAESFYGAVKSTRKTNNTKVDENARWDALAIDPATLDKLKLFCQLLRDSESWSAQGIEVPKSLLLYGPSGTGKTQIARTLANESGLGFTAATSADVKGIHLGESGNRVKLIFSRARGQAPAILFLDELDIVAPKRGATKDPLTEEIVGQLLQEMDGIEAHANQVFVVAATNRPDSIDPAIVSRFQKRIEVPLPDHRARLKLLTTRLSKKRLSFDLNGTAQALADRTDGKSHRDLISLISEAEEKALMRAIHDGGPEHFSLQLEDFN
jgi:transitional endoplasmic reticulum ATPase